MNFFFHAKSNVGGTHSQSSHEVVEIEMDNIGSGSQAGPSTGGGQSLGEFFKEVSIKFYNLVL